MPHKLLWLAVLLNTTYAIFAFAAPSRDWQSDSIQAFKAFQAGDYSQAVILYRSGLRNARAISVSCDGTQETRDNLGILYAALQRYDDAKHVIVDGFDNECNGNRVSDAALVSRSSALGELYRAEHKYREAEETLRSALDMAERLYGREHPQVAFVLTNLGQLYIDERHVAVAKPMLERATTILQNSSLVDQHFASALNQLAECHLLEKQYTRAQPLLTRSIFIYEHTLGPEHPYLAAPLSNLGFVYNADHQYVFAIPVLKRALSITEKSLGDAHPQIGQILDILAASYWGQQHGEEADLCLRRAVSIVQHGSAERFDRIRYSHDLADLDRARHNYKEAEHLYRYCLGALSDFDREQALQTELMQDLAQLLRTTRRTSTSRNQELETTIRKPADAFLEEKRNWRRKLRWN